VVPFPYGNGIGTDSHLSINFYPLFSNGNPAADILRVVPVGKPTLVAKGFGHWLAHVRGRRSYEQIAGPVRDFLKPIDMKVHPSLLVKVEQGRVPNVLLLAALSRVLKVPVDEMFARLLDDLHLDAGAVRIPPVPPSERAMALARWFDRLPPLRQNAIVEALNVPELVTRASSKKGA
jgi:hypothetical protein